ncbi:MAG: glycoside hydrolase family 57 protein [Gammaproteobacteria bacterium]|nr:glycoside hydrolase family 57 protein [Gammaproteobacteria bacterium]
MPVKPRLKVILYWHMHQPEYRDRRNNAYHLPWTYLHATKDYVDMVAHLEAIPEARAVVNFAPTLLEQIDDYAQQINEFLHNSTAITDPLLSALAEPVLPSSTEQRLGLLKSCLRANEERLIKRFPVYARLADYARWLLKNPESLMYVSDQLLIDLLVWYHLAWMGETVRRSDARVKRLQDKQEMFSLHDRRELLTIMSELLTGVIARYRTLAEKGQVELSMTPYAHPIMPLLLDLKSTHEAMPDVPLPHLPEYPGGEERVRWHIEQGIKSFEHYFGIRPHGCWPSEGSVSEATVRLLGEYDFDWLASGETVLRNSLAGAIHTTAENQESCIHKPYRLIDSEPVIFFRDDGLSDLIGFTYSEWHADDAVANLIGHLETIASECKNEPNRVVSIILDGENAWEYYPENGFYFLQALYRELVAHPGIELTTYSECLKNHCEVADLPQLVAGSWVYGTFSTWIGEADKNHGWDMLGDAKHTFDAVIASGKLDDEHRRRAEMQMAICEGSDWFWWFGDYNPAESVSDFDHLYRLQLSNLYQILGSEPPAYLAESFTHGTGAPAMGGVMRTGKQQ